MKLRLLNWKGLLLNLSAGTLLCASVGCKTTRTEGPTLNAPTKAMGPGNQVLTPGTSPAFNNLSGQGPVNSLPGSQTNTSTAQMNRGNMGAPMQSAQQPQLNPGTNNPAPLGQQNVPMHNVVVPTQFGQQGFAPNGYPQQNPVQMMPQQQMPQNFQQMPQNFQQMPQNFQQQMPQNFQQMPQNFQQQMPQNFQQQMPQNFQQMPPNYQQQLPQQQNPAMPVHNQGMPTSLNVPDKLPTNAREAANLSGPSLMLPASHNAGSPTLDLSPTVQKEPTAKVIAEYDPRKKSADAPVVTVTPLPDVKEPPFEAPVFYPK